MNLERLGSLHPFRLSFMRILMRRIMAEKWQIKAEMFDLDQEGLGTAVYTIDARHGQYSFAVFANYLSPEKRSDRVIADQWDMTVTLCEGRVDDARLERLRSNVPLQEAGRLDSSCIILSRANKSSRNFDYVVDTLASGQQPSLQNIARVGYLYRTTAVYGSGKFGMADWQKVHVVDKDFSRPFAAEMFTCYLIRHFSLEQAEHIARQRCPSTAVELRDDIKRYFGIGNATGLGMAPFLINHPQLVGRWILVRETALARVIKFAACDEDSHARMLGLIDRAATHLAEIDTDNDIQSAANRTLLVELAEARRWLQRIEPTTWRQLVSKASATWTTETQELLNSLLLELHPQLIDDLEDELCVEESMHLVPGQPLTEFLQTIEADYDWALAIDFTKPHSRAVFWYRSLEKSEPRLGNHGVDPGADKAMNLAVAWDVRQCYEQVCECLAVNERMSIADFLLRHSNFRSIVRRIQTLAKDAYGDIQANLLDRDVLPIHLLRCKLSFFGVSKFDPKSRMWVRNTMFQGAPLVSDIGTEYEDDWYFPVMPRETASEHD